ncbi:MAG TPA: hypothetical protein VIC71_10805 [Gammaproteobacteria bacterium]|jgi:hypothetical protein
MTQRIALLFGLSLIAGLASAQSAQEIRTQFFAEVDAVKAQADELNAKMLAPEVYAEGLELYVEAGDTLAKGKNLDDVREDLAEAKGHFQTAVEKATLANTTFAGALTARGDAEKAGAAQYAARDWQKAEEELVEAATVLEGGNLKRAADLAGDIEKSYREVEADAIAAKARAGAN